MDNTRLPAEWEPQSGILLTWPHARSDWRPWLEEAERTFTELALRISQYQPLLITCYDAEQRQRVRHLLTAAGAEPARIKFYTVPSNDTWVRDHGPITVYRNGRPVLLDFRFNGWGGKFSAELDDQISRRLHQAGAFGQTPLASSDLILEGGSIECDGRGTLLTTRRCLLSATRNALDQRTLERRLSRLLGVTRFFWLEHGQLSGDDTDSHIDTLARFCDPETIAYQNCADPDDEHFAELTAMARELATLRTLTGKPYRLIPLPLPQARFNTEGRRLPAGYANFLILNGAVLVPVYHDPADAIALERLRSCFPGRQVLGVPCMTLIQQYGSLHCVTMQLPQNVLSPRSMTMTP